MSRFITYCALFLLYVNLKECSEILSKEAVKEYNPCKVSEVPYKKDTCIKNFFFTDDSYSEAEGMCHLSIVRYIVIIDSAEKQKFVQDYLKSENEKRNIWLGLKYSNDVKDYLWPFDRIADYTNWEEGHPTNDTKNCVQLNIKSGKWSEKPCQEKNTYLCERIQKRFGETMIESILVHLSKDKIPLVKRVKDLALKNNQLETKVKDLALNNNQLENKVKDLDLKISQLESKMKNLMTDTIPIGFTYVQLPKDKPPTEIWPSFKWVSVSHDYEGIFFRVEGKNSSIFGAVQEQSTERINEVSVLCKNRPKTISDGYPYHSKIKTNKWTDEAYTGGPDTGCQIKFFAEKAEIRPRNMAIKIWRRDA